MKKILFVSDVFPLPENSGNSQRSMMFIRYFREHGQIDLVYTFPAEIQLLDRNYYKYFRKIYAFPQKRKDDPLTKNDIRKMYLKKYPDCVRKKYFKSYGERLKALIKKENYDIIFIRYVFNVQYLVDANPSIREKVILDMDDVISASLYESTYSIATKYAIKKWLDFNLLKIYEKKCIKNFKKVFVTSREDLDRFKKHKNKLNYVPNVIHSKNFQNVEIGDGFQNLNKILFVGTLNYKPNIDGLEWFLYNIFIYFRKIYKKATLTIIGRDPLKKVFEFSSISGVYLFPNVPDVLPYYEKCGFVVVPVISGGGTRIKIIEAAALNRPILSTSYGASGLELKDNKEILIFNDLRSFVDKYRYLQSRKNYQSLIYLAKNRMMKEYSTQNFFRKMDSILEN